MEKKLLVKYIDVLGFYWGSYRLQAPQLVTQGFATLGHMVEAGKLHPHISAALPMSDWRQGFEELLGRRSTGKIVLLPET